MNASDMAHDLQQKSFFISAINDNLVFEVKHLLYQGVKDSRYDDYRLNFKTNKMIKLFYRVIDVYHLPSDDNC